MKPETFDKGMAILVMAVRSIEVDEPTLAIWRELLSDLTDDQFMVAIAYICREKVELYPGTNIVALIRDKAFRDMQALAAEAWGEVKHMVSSCGYYSYPKFSSERIQKVVDIMGWRDICCSENPEANRAHFIRIYESISERDKELKMIGRGPEIRRLISKVSDKRSIK